MTLLRDLAATLPVEYTPQGEILCELLVVMLDPGSDEQEIAWLERIPLATVNENAAAANDDVNFILRVGRL